MRRTRAAHDAHLAPGQAAGPVQLARALGRLGPRVAGTVLTVVASEHRAQFANRKAARGRLDALLAPVPPARRPTRPSAGARARRRGAKQRRSAVKRLRARPDD